MHPSAKARIRYYAQRRFHPKDIAALTGYPIDIVRQVISVKTLRAERAEREAAARREQERLRRFCERHKRGGAA